MKVVGWSQRGCKGHVHEGAYHLLCGVSAAYEREAEERGARLHAH